MRRHLTFALIATLFLSLAATAETPDEAGFRALFNGKDLTGWTYNGQPLGGKTETPDQRFLVVDGAIVAAEGKGTKNLMSAANFDKDFQLKLEFRAGPKADSGVYVRGPQLQVRDFIRRKEHMHLEKVYKNDDWNELTVTFDSKKWVAMIDGKPLSAPDMFVMRYTSAGGMKAELNGKPIDPKVLQFSQGATICHLNGIAFDPTYKAGAKGPIGLQAETGKFEFRRLRIKELP